MQSICKYISKIFDVSYTDVIVDIIFLFLKCRDFYILILFL